MKKHLLTLTLVLAFAGSTLFAHEKGKFGPNGGRMLQFSTDGTLHAEVTAGGGNFFIALLDKEMKPAATEGRTITATTADRQNPEKLEVTRTEDGKFVVPMQKGDKHWTIFQFRDTPDSKPVIARLPYDASICPECKKAEWLCDCASEEAGKK